MSDHLQTILEHKQREVEVARDQRPLAELKAMIAETGSVRDFPGALRSPGNRVIAEIKRASPSRGTIAREFDHRQLASDFEKGGACALSVLTDERYFQGDPRFIREVKAVSSLPVLRKDFILDEYQVFESRALGADAILLIVRALEEETLGKLLNCAAELGLGALVEVHDVGDLGSVNRIRPEVVGVNNRDLADFSVSLDRSRELRGKIKGDCITVSESGISTRDDIAYLKKAGFDAFLVGEALMTSTDRIKTLLSLTQER